MSGGRGDMENWRWWTIELAMYKASTQPGTRCVEIHLSAPQNQIPIRITLVVMDDLDLVTDRFSSLEQDLGTFTQIMVGLWSLRTTRSECRSIGFYFFGLRIVRTDTAV